MVYSVDTDQCESPSLINGKTQGKTLKIKFLFEWKRRYGIVMRCSFEISHSMSLIVSELLEYRR